LIVVPVWQTIVLEIHILVVAVTLAVVEVVEEAKVVVDLCRLVLSLPFPIRTTVL
jgi:hypothetical protein